MSKNQTAIHNFPITVSDASGTPVVLNTLEEFKKFYGETRSSVKAVYTEPRKSMNSKISEFKKSWHRAATAAERKAALKKLAADLEPDMDILKK